MAVVWPSKNNFANGDVLTATNMNNIGDTLNVFNPTSATNGQIWVANGSGSGSFQTVSASSMTLLTSGSLTSGASVTSATISATGYQFLYVVAWGCTASAAFKTTISPLPASGTTDYFRYIEAGVTTANGTGANTRQGPASFNFAATGGVNQVEAWFFLPTATTGYQYSFGNFQGYDGATYQNGQRWASNNRTAAITSFSFATLTGATWSAGSYQIFGVK